MGGRDGLGTTVWSRQDGVHWALGVRERAGEGPR